MVLDYPFVTGRNSWARVFLTENYDNGNPPPDGVVKVTGVSGAGATPVLSDADNEELLLFYANHPPRPNYPVIYTASYSDDIGPTGLFLFFNGKTSSGSHWDVFFSDSTFTYYPEYFNASLDNRVRSTNIFTGETTNIASRNFTSSAFQTVKNKYSHFVFYPLSAMSDSGAPAPRSGFNRKRVFTKLKTNNGLALDTLRSKNHTSVLAVLTAPQGYTTDLQGLFGSQQVSSSEFIAGIAEIDAEVVASHDPNSLVLIEACGIPNGDVRLTFQFTICNDGTGTEYNPAIRFTDLSGKMINPVLYAPKVGQSGKNFELPGPGPTWEISAKKLMTLPPAARNPFQPSCDSVMISFLVNAADAKYFGQGIENFLRACVKFSGDIEFAHCAEAEKDPLFFYSTDINGILKQPEACPGGIFPLWAFVALGAALLAALLLWRRMRS